jgi:type VI secretion system ImpH/TssG family protein
MTAHPPQEHLLERANEFEFRQWIRLWLREHLAKARENGPDLAALLEEGLEIFHSGSMLFASQDIAQARRLPSGRDELRVHFMGLLGASSPLPSHLVDPLQSADDRWAALRDFHRIFENRSYQLLALALLRCSAAIRVELADADDLQVRLDLLSHTGDRRSRPAKLGGFSHLARCARGKSALWRFLSRQLGTDRIRIDDALVAWIPNPAACTLGTDSVLDGSRAIGSSMPVRGARLAVEIGPLPWEEYHRWTVEPAATGSGLRALVEGFVDREVDWEAWAALDPASLPPGQGRLLGEGAAQARLGHAAWLGEDGLQAARSPLAKSASFGGGACPST